MLRDYDGRACFDMVAVRPLASIIRARICSMKGGEGQGRGRKSGIDVQAFYGVCLFCWGFLLY
jgi:hypothetical protein